jgi:hypothetical protein
MLESTIPGVILMAIGLSLSMLGWTRYRHPGQKFWFFGPVWRASDFVTPVGVRLWQAGSIIGLLGALWVIATY